MAYGGSHKPGLRGAFPFAVVLLIIAMLLPARWSGWLSALSGPVETVVAPVSGPIRATLNALSPAAVGTMDEGLVADLEYRVEMLTQELEKERRRRELIEQLYEDLGSGVAIPPETPIRIVRADAYGNSSDLGNQTLKLRVFAAEGEPPIDVASVATYQNRQLVGMAEPAVGQTVVVRLLTDRGVYQGVLQTEDGRELAVGGLRPDGAGGLVGDVEYAPERPGETVEVPRGAVVRLRDPTFPPEAQGLILGVVTNSLPSDEIATRTRVVIRPGYSLDQLIDLSRLTGGVYLRVPRATGGGS